MAAKAEDKYLDLWSAIKIRMVGTRFMHNKCFEFQSSRQMLCA